MAGSVDSPEKDVRPQVQAGPSVEGRPPDRAAHRSRLVVAASCLAMLTVGAVSAPERRGAAIGAWAGFLMVGFSLGPLIGGALTARKPSEKEAVWPSSPAFDRYRGAAATIEGANLIHLDAARPAARRSPQTWITGIDDAWDRRFVLHAEDIGFGIAAQRLLFAWSCWGRGLRQGR